MTDPKRLPVITVALLEYGNGELFVSSAHVKGGRRSGYTVPDAIVVDYPPAVPRCATCEHYGRDSDEEKDWRYCEQTDFEDGIPQDGTGYCHMHQKAIR